MIGYQDHGSGTDLVLLHGVGLDRHMWDRCLPALAARHRTRAVDLRGHADSPPAAPGTTLDDLATDVLDTLEGPAHLVGFSLGALVATRAALLRPTAVASLTLVSSVARRTPEESQDVAGRLERAREDFPGSVDAAIDRWFTREWQAAEPGLVEEVRATLLSQNHTSYLACYEVFTRADAELWPQLPSLTVPTLAVTGGADPGSTEAMTRALAGAVPGARAAVIPGARHLLALEAPDRLTDEIIRHTTEVDRDRTAAPAA
ncbi:alpha/beta fold hydrolase [Streptomyces sp. NBC_01197]|uniref:alpha/beta fold hydrolase n=1 Tax=Streptomyces sp. NBC_01197 TaxID=2903768 RepID=UPI002E160E89|nr:alpha/beta fold hydrolase [Streptomyces sp. NBC_01197]